MKDNNSPVSMIEYLHSVNFFVYKHTSNNEVKYLSDRLLKSDV